MTDRFTIQDSAIVKDGHFIKDEKNIYTFPTTTSYGNHLHMYCKALNELHWSKQLLEIQVKRLHKSRNHHRTKNERFELLLDEFIKTERTEIGKSVLRQLKGALE